MLNSACEGLVDWERSGLVGKGGGGGQGVELGSTGRGGCDHLPDADDWESSL